MADSRIFGDGWTPNALIVGAAGTITPPVPCNIDAGETHVRNLTQNVNRVFASTTLDVNGLATLVTLDTTGWLATDRFSFVLSAASTNHANLFAALTAAGTSDIVMGTPNMEDPATPIINAFFFDAEWNFSNLTVRSFSPLVKIDTLETGFINVVISGLILEDIIFQGSMVLSNKAHTVTFRRCYFNGRGVNARFIDLISSAGAGTVLTMESCITRGIRSDAFRHVSTLSNAFLRHCMDVGSITSFNVISKTRLNGCVAIPGINGFLGTPDVSSDHNWSTGTAPGTNSLSNRAVDDAKLIIFEDPSALPNNAILPFLAYFPKDASEWKGAATFLSGVDRRDFFGYLRPTSGAWTIGPINLESTNGGVVWPGYTGAADFPAVGDVESGVQYDNGNLTGTFAVPIEADVRQSTQYGADGTEFTGILAPGAVIPNTPTLILVSRSSGQAEFSVTDVDAGVTVRILFSIDGGNFQLGVTRVGSGNLIQTGLPDNVPIIFEAIAQN